MPNLINRYIIFGRVQGVGFRRFAQRCANEFSIGGWVKNRADGSVEIQAIGGSCSINSFIDKISEGSWFSEVEEVELISSEPTNSLVGEFVIKR